MPHCWKSHVPVQIRNKFKYHSMMFSLLTLIRVIKNMKFLKFVRMFLPYELYIVNGKNQCAYLFVLILYITINNFSVMSRRVFLG